MGFGDVADFWVQEFLKHRPHKTILSLQSGASYHHDTHRLGSGFEQNQIEKYMMNILQSRDIPFLEFLPHLLKFVPFKF